MIFTLLNRPARLALFVALAAAPALAQQPRPAAPPAAPPPQGALVPLPQATPAHLAAARDLVISSGLRRTFVSVIPDLMRQMNGTVTRTRPELMAPMKTTLDALEKEFLGYADELVDPAARVYTALLSEQECKDAAAFFKSPTGTKYIDSQPSIFANLTPMMEAWSKQLSVKIYERTREEMKKKGHDI